MTDSSDPLLSQALRLATRAHEGQRRDDGSPYVSHPLAVLAILRDEIGIDDPRVLAAGLLHDVLEDTGVLAEEMERLVGSTVTGWVRGLTKETRTGESRAARIERDLERVRRAGTEAISVKVADRLHNLRTIAISPDATKRRRFLDETRRLYLPFFERFAPEGSPLVRTALEDAERADASHSVRTSS